mmetsp:Transcript_17762/g.41357  ORF Transcript_17762/g.41357 Transcript_17762/m.41357 type:complete len:245 (+) Transcript_17762:205-939(+)|eukprot:CAMPEP_0178428198 /NCGR_PEP_ID=MMETSP0689_2-20121128/30150_1 /TAXON_ID=160604 /ORGANISM="Amphidinium massartii, Strain CS-259" /LENGTH=244 /DNA_ID=CAMNT_0020049955 /DNA_START=116 /DNA_END=850 /DNA_ORIENTATION=+
MSASAVEEAIKKLSLTDGDGEALQYVSYRTLESERQEIFATAFPECGASQVFAISARHSSGAIKELIGVLEGTADAPSVQLVTASCSITYEDLSPSDCIEYAFAEEAPPRWHLAQLSREALETYRGMKFEAWKQMLHHTTCEAQLRRMLQIGLVNRLYDPNVFPTPDSLRAQYQVTDDKTGKLIDLPHPVGSLRVWDAEAKAYTSLSPQLDGAPSEADKAGEWARIVANLKESMGEEYIASFMK